MEKEQISPAEWQVMRVVWANPQATSQFIIDSLSQHFNWQAATIKTLLGRLKNKGLISMHKKESKYYYQAAVTEEEQLDRSVEKLQSSICNKKQADLIKLFLEKGEFTKADLKAISQLALKMSQHAPQQLICNCLRGQCTCAQERSCRHD